MEHQDILNHLTKRLTACDLCPNHCGCDRISGQTGICGNTTKPAIYQHFVHLGEEISLVPAFIINMSGCSLSCPTCSERCHFFQKSLPISEPELYARALAGHFSKTGMPRSIEWIGGEPSTQIQFILATSWKLRELLNPCPPIYLNTNAWFDPNLLDLMHEAIDGFVFDLKCCPGCSREITGTENYWNTAVQVIERGAESFPGPHILRHLVMPGHVMCCTNPVIEWCVGHIPDVTINLMTTFHDFRDSRNGLTEEEKKQALEMLMSARLPYRMHNGRHLNSTE